MLIALSGLALNNIVFNAMSAFIESSDKINFKAVV